MVPPGNRPNLNQMWAAAVAQISDDVVKARLLDEIGRAKSLTSGASALGVRVHTLPTKPKDIGDDGFFRYAILPPSAASDSGKPSAEAKRYLDVTTGSEKPRVFRNAVLLLTASRDGLEVAHARVREFLAWEKVKGDLTPKNEQEKKQKGSVDVARMQSLAINIDKARGRVPDAIRQAYCIVADKDEVQAFKISVTDGARFETIKNDARSRARFIALTDDSAPWTCDLPAAQTVKIELATAGTGGATGDTQPTMLVASAEFEPSEIQDLADLVPQLLDFKAKAKVPLRFHVRLEVGDGTQKPTGAAVAELNKLLDGLKDGFEAR